MKQIRIFLFALLCTFLALPAMAQEGKGIQFFKGTFAQALAKAKAEGKPLFVDFYAVWCGPCKKMEKQIFTQSEVGEYFNKHFVALQLDAEKPENVDVAKTYKVEAFPTLGIFDGEGKALSINVGYMNAQELMAMAKTAVGEVKGFEQLYKEYRQNPNDLTIQQDLLTLAPQFLTTQDGMDAEKWVVRVRKIYQAYIEKKMSDNSLINRKDYVIIGYLGGDDEESTYRLVDYISNNMDAWMAAVGEPAAYYVVEKNDERMLKLVKKGDESYKTYLEKIRTDYKKASTSSSSPAPPPTTSRATTTMPSLPSTRTRMWHSISNSCANILPPSVLMPMLPTMPWLRNPSITLLATNSVLPTTNKPSNGSRWRFLPRKC